ncbi:MAG: shikimate dehydrogenase [Ignavibacteria bacterium]|nr:shikimate dehydrogenase [Ignavibacteria bacterium]
MKRFGVIGQPIAHSLSPLLHNTAFSLLGLDCSYEAFDIDPASLPAAIREFKDQGFVGLNVTIPHKESMLSLVDELTDEAKAVGAVNTVTLSGGRIRGDNTDVYGVAASLEQYRSEIRDRIVVLIGAGGSARAITYALIDRFAPAEIVIANRTQRRAQDLIADVEPYAKKTSLRAISVSDENLDRLMPSASVVINATPVGMFPLVDHSPIGDKAGFHSGQIVMDLIYTPLETRFLSLASKCGARTISGLEMFLHQGARSFEIWLGRQLPLEQIRPVILNQLHTRKTTAKP